MTMPKTRMSRNSHFQGAKAIRASIHQDNGIMVVPSRLTRDKIRSEMKRIIENDHHHVTKS
jgi:hypothetical protein